MGNYLGIALLVVFVEQSIVRPTEIEGEWKAVMAEGAGALDQTCARSIHVIAVPPGLIPSPVHSKPEILVNLEVGDRGELGRLLSDVAYDVTGERITNSSRSVL